MNRDYNMSELGVQSVAEHRHLTWLGQGSLKSHSRYTVPSEHLFEWDADITISLNGKIRQRVDQVIRQ